MPRHNATVLKFLCLAITRLYLLTARKRDKTLRVRYFGINVALKYSHK